jgi:hypothetical protein
MARLPGGISGTYSRFDDSGVGALLRSLEDREQQVLQIKYPEQKFSSGSLVPIETRNRPWAKTISYRQADMIGQFALVNDYISVLPQYDVIQEEFVHQVRKWGASYRVTDTEAVAAAHLGEPIDSQRMEGVRKGYEQHLNKLIAYGDPQTSTPGFLNHPSTLRTIAPYPLDSRSSSGEMLTTLNEAVTHIIEVTDTIESPDTMLLDYRTYEFLNSRRLDGTVEANATILKTFLATNPHIKNVEPVIELDPKYLGGNKRAMIVYKRDPSCLKAIVEEAFDFRKLLEDDTGYRRTATFTYGTLIYYRPYSCNRVEWAI